MSVRLLCGDNRQVSSHSTGSFVFVFIILNGWELVYNSRKYISRFVLSIAWPLWNFSFFWSKILGGADRWGRSLISTCLKFLVQTSPTILIFLGLCASRWLQENSFLIGASIKVVRMFTHCYLSMYVRIN